MSITKFIGMKKCTKRNDADLSISTVCRFFYSHNFLSPHIFPFVLLINKTCILMGKFYLFPLDLLVAHGKSKERESQFRPVDYRDYTKRFRYDGNPVKEEGVKERFPKVINFVEPNTIVGEYVLWKVWLK